MQGDGEPEGGSLLVLTADTNVTTHHGDQLFGHSQAQAGPSEIAGCGAVSLNKAVKNFFLLSLGNADPGVLHLAAQFHVIRGFLIYVGPDEDMTCTGKFDGISQKIDDDLANAGGISL